MNHMFVAVCDVTKWCCYLGMLMDLLLGLLMASIMGLLFVSSELGIDKNFFSSVLSNRYLLVIKTPIHV